MLQSKDPGWLNRLKKNKTYLNTSYNRLTSELKTQRLKLRGLKKIFCTNGNIKKAGVVILIVDKIDFKTKTITSDKGHYIMIKGSIQQEDITIINIYAPNIGACQYIKKILTDTKGELDSNTIVGDFNNPLYQWMTDHPDRKSIRKHWP